MLVDFQFVSCRFAGCAYENSQSFACSRGCLARYSELRGALSKALGISRRLFLVRRVSWQRLSGKIELSSQMRTIWFLNARYIAVSFDSFWLLAVNVCLVRGVVSFFGLFNAARWRMVGSFGLLGGGVVFLADSQSGALILPAGRRRRRKLKKNALKSV